MASSSPNVERIDSVAHALAFCHAVEMLSHTEVPFAVQLLRVVLPN
jgi:Ni,Fe-hydrogenase III large subunit